MHDAASENIEAAQSRSSPEDLGKLSEQGPVHVQRGHPELGRECRTMVDPGLQRRGTIYVCMLDQHLPDLGAAQPARLLGFYVAQGKPGACARGTRSPTRIIEIHSASSPILGPTQGPSPTIARSGHLSLSFAPNTVKNLPYLSGRRRPELGISEALMGSNLTPNSQEIANMLVRCREELRSPAT